MKAFGIGAALALAIVCVIAIVAVLLPLVLFVVFCADVVDDVRATWRAIASAVRRRRAHKARGLSEWARLQQLARDGHGALDAPDAKAIVFPARLTSEELTELKAAYARAYRGCTRTVPRVH